MGQEKEDEGAEPFLPATTDKPEYTEAQLRPKTFWQINEDTGICEEIDPVTGSVVRVALDPGQLASPHAQFVEADINGTRVMVQTGVNHANLDFINRYPYSEALADVIAQKIMEGTLFTEIPLLANMPRSATLNAWMREHKYFKEKITEARKYRAEYYRDKAVKVGEGSIGVHRDEVPGRKLAVETYRWAAEKDDPAVFGTRVQVEGTVHVEMRLETGIRRPQDQGAPVIIVQTPPSKLSQNNDVAIDITPGSSGVDSNKKVDSNNDSGD